MKTLFRIVLALLFFTVRANAQILNNDPDFTLIQGNPISHGTCGCGNSSISNDCSTYPLACSPYWFRSPGTPDWINPTQICLSAASSCGLDNNIHLIGSGIAEDFNFYHGLGYDISIKVDQFTNSIVYDDCFGHRAIGPAITTLEIWASDNTISRDPSLAGACLSQLSSYPVPTGSELIGSFSSLSTITSSFVINKRFYPTSDHTTFWLLFKSNADALSIYPNIILDYAKISACYGRNEYNEYSGEIAAGTHYACKIFIEDAEGSDWPGSGTLVTASTNASTTLIANEIVASTDNQGFLATASSNTYFLALAETRECCPDTSNGGHGHDNDILPPPHETNIYKPTQNYYANETINTAVNNRPTQNNNDIYINDGTNSVLSTSYPFRLYPDPTTGILNLSYYCNKSGELNITIKNITGGTMQSYNNYCNEGITINQQIDISALPKGMYIIDITLAQQHIIKKISKI